MTVRANDALIQTGITDGAAGIRGDGMGALDWTRSLLTVHHLILIRGEVGGRREKKEGWN